MNEKTYTFAPSADTDNNGFDLKEWSGAEVRIVCSVAEDDVDRPDVGKMFVVSPVENDQVTFQAFEDELEELVG